MSKSTRRWALNENASIVLAENLVFASKRVNIVNARIAPHLSADSYRVLSVRACLCVCVSGVFFCARACIRLCVRCTLIYPFVELTQVTL